MQSRGSRTSVHDVLRFSLFDVADSPPGTITLRGAVPISGDRSVRCATLANTVTLGFAALALDG